MRYISEIRGDDELIKDLCTKLNNLIKSIIHIDPNFIYIGSKEKGYYSIYNENKYGKKIDVSLNFRLYYPDKKSFYFNKEAKSLNEEDLNKLLYAEIEWFSVNPRRKGIGSSIINQFINILKNIEEIEFILLTPKNNNARSFWYANNFIEEDYSIYLDKRVKSCACKRLIYKFKMNDYATIK